MENMSNAKIAVEVEAIVEREPMDIVMTVVQSFSSEFTHCHRRLENVVVGLRKFESSVYVMRVILE